MRCYIFDVDGTLADLSHRLHFIKPKLDVQGNLPAKDWKLFFAACSDDKPITHVIELCRDLVPLAPVVFVSGRSDECRAATEAWLLKHVGTAGTYLFMRKEGDHRPDNVVKEELLIELRARGYQPVMAFDDRDQVVKMWRKLGVPCAQVADGNF